MLSRRRPGLSSAQRSCAKYVACIVSDAQLAGAIVSSARFEGAILNGTDMSGVIVRKDINDKLCATAKGVRCCPCAPRAAWPRLPALCQSRVMSSFPS